MDEKKEVLLSVRNLQQYFKMGRKINKAVDGISFDIYKGEVFGLVGESGCGKTTTGRSIIRLYDITGGSVYFKGHRICAGTNTYKEAIAAARRDCERRIAELGKNADPAGIAALRAERDSFIRRQQEEIRQARYDQKYCNKQYSKNEVERVKAGYEAKLAAASGSEREALSQKMEHEIMLARSDRITNKIQMIFQDPIASLDPRMTVREIIAEGLIIRGVHDRKYIDEQVYRVLDLVGLVPEHAGRYPHEFSGGQRQRIGIARAIILQPDLIIADEPISALDVSIQAQVINLLNELRNSLGLTILFIAHDLSVVPFISDRIAVISKGRIVELAETEELFRHPLHPYTKALLSAVPIPDPGLEKKKQLLVYDPSIHDYSVDKPLWQEIANGHFVYGNQKELEGYRKEYESQRP